MTPPKPNVSLDPRELARTMSHRVAAAEARVRAVAANVDARAAFASYSLSRLCAKDTRAEHSRPAPVAVELAAWILYPEFGRSAVREPARIQEIIDALEEYSTSVTLAEMFPELPDGEVDDSLAVHVRLHSGLVRGSAYAIQLQQRIQGLMGPFESEFAALAGIGPCRAFEVLGTIGTTIEDNVERMRDAYRSALGRGNEIAARKTARTEEDDAELKSIGILLRDILSGMDGEWVPTYEQVAQRVPNLTIEEWHGLRDAIGLIPTTRSQLVRIVEVQDRPLFFLDDDRAFYVHSGQCFDAVFTWFDELARRTPSLRDRYGNQIAEWMERQIETKMLRLFPAAHVLRNACFTDPDNEGGQTEADVVVIWGPFLIVLEAKGKRIAPEAMRGSRSKLKRAIAQNIQDAFFQARRVVRVLGRDGRIKFTEKATGRTVEVTEEQLRRIMPISVTLQHLSGIPTQLALTQQLGLFKGRAYPWSVSIDDLDVITRFADSPDVFLHYIERRLAHQLSDVTIHGDELDLFGHYLDNRLHPGIYEQRKEISEHQGARMISIDSGEERFEPFYVAEWLGEPLPDRKSVGLKVPPEINAVLHELRSREDDGARWIAFALLGLNNAALGRLEGALQQFRHTTAERHRLLRTTAREGDIVINVMAHNSFDAVEFNNNLLARTRMEHYRSKARATITFGIDQRDASKPFESAHWMEGAWERDEAMENLLAADRERPRVMQMLSGAAKPGRNNPCPCGSGKKYKRCCINRIQFQRVPLTTRIDHGGQP